MIKLKEKLAKKKKGSGLLLVMILVFFMITFIVTVGEFYRVHIMQQEIEMHLQRTVNCAVEYAMGDSYRQDKIVNLNVGLAKNKFYKFLGDDMGLDSYNRKYRDGKFIYRLNFTSVNGTSNPAVFTVKGYATARSLFSFLIGEIEIPFNISSTNGLKLIKFSHITTFASLKYLCTTAPAHAAICKNFFQFKKYGRTNLKKVLY